MIKNYFYLSQLILPIFSLYVNIVILKPRFHLGLFVLLKNIRLVKIFQNTTALFYLWFCHWKFIFNSIKIPWTKYLYFVSSHELSFHSSIIRNKESDNFAIVTFQMLKLPQSLHSSLIQSPHASNAPPSSLTRQTCGSNICGHEMIWKTGFGLSEGLHWTLTGPSAVCLQSKQVCGWCSQHGTALHPAASGQTRDLSEDPVCRLQLQF